MNLRDSWENILAFIACIVIIWKASGAYHRLEQNVQLSRSMDVREQRIDKELEQRITKLENKEKCIK